MDSYTIFYAFLLFGGLIVDSFLCVDAQKMNDKATLLTDASEVTWAHAVNSRSSLAKELDGPVHFLEADVSMGHVIGNVIGRPIPIMAHPPNITSDISLQDWIDAVINADTGKGVKLDFKSIDVVEPSLIILQKKVSELNFTLWLNADILIGPVNSTTIPVNYEPFLLLCNQYFPNAVLSVGWTTSLRNAHSVSWNYEWKHVRKMADIIRCFGYETRYPKFTFPVRGVFASRSIKKLQWLLATIPGSSITVWSSRQDPLTLKDLIQIRTSFPKDKVYYDVPETLHKLFLEIKDNQSYNPSQRIEVNDDQWMVLTQGSDHSCESHTYVSNNTAVFGRTLTTAALLKKLLFVDDRHTLRAKGKVEFFPDYDQQAQNEHELTIVVTDVSLFSKNSSDSEHLDLSGSDTDVLWEALNASHLHTFVYSFSMKPSACRVFSLDSSADRSFQAWTVPCDKRKDQIIVEEELLYGVPEVSSRKRMVFPKGPFMIGFISTGDGHVVVHDFEVSGKKENISNALSASIRSFTSMTFIGLTILAGYIVKIMLF